MGIVPLFLCSVFPCTRANRVFAIFLRDNIPCHASIGLTVNTMSISIVISYRSFAAATSILPEPDGLYFANAAT